MAMSQTDVCVPRTVIDSRFDLENRFRKSCRISFDIVAKIVTIKVLEYEIHMNHEELFDSQLGNGIAAARKCLVSMRKLELVMEHPSVGYGNSMPLSYFTSIICIMLRFPPTSPPLLFSPFNLKSSSRRFIHSIFLVDVLQQHCTYLCVVHDT